MQLESCATPVPRSLVWATDLDTLPLDRVVERRDGYLLIRSPGNPAHYWGNLLLFDEPPPAGDGWRWQELFEGYHPLGLYESLGSERLEHVVGVCRWTRV